MSKFEYLNPSKPSNQPADRGLTGGNASVSQPLWNEQRDESIHQVNQVVQDLRANSIEQPYGRKQNYLDSQMLSRYEILKNQTFSFPEGQRAHSQLQRHIEETRVTHSSRYQQISLKRKSQQANRPVHSKTLTLPVFEQVATATHFKLS